MYKLIGSTTSPFVRKLRLFLIQNNIPFELVSINYLEKNDSDYLKSINPINKIPVLVITENGKEQVLYDSRVMYNYFCEKYSIPKLSLNEENIYSAIDGALETSINLFALKRGGLDLNSGNNYIERQKERVPLILSYLSSWIKSLDSSNPLHWNILTMSLYSYLYWGQFREILDLKDFPECQTFLNNFADKLGVNETRPN